MEDDLKMHHDGAFMNFEMNTIGSGTSHKWMFSMAQQMAHTGLSTLPKEEVSVSNMFERGAVKAAPAIAKGWTDVRSLPVAPKSKDQFRKWYKNHKKESEK